MLQDINSDYRHNIIVQSYNSRGIIYKYNLVANLLTRMSPPLWQPCI